ncbi:MAG: DUF4124 domain-containing protein, partial [candidate division NC10 bacterium]
MREATRVRAIVMLVLGVLVLLPADAGAQTYRWVDDKGVVHYAQGIDSVPERYRDPRLPPVERAAALEAVKALKDLESLVDPAMGSFGYQWRLRKLDEVVAKDLRAIRRGPVKTALAGALNHYRLAGQLIERGAVVSRNRPAGSDQPCRRLARPPAPGEASASAEDRTAALQAVWRCASDRTAAAEALTLRPGSGPWAERVQAPAKPRR